MDVRPLIDPSDIPQLIKDEGLQICVVSHGGCGSNTLVRCLERNGFICRTPTWERVLCHFPYPIDSPIKFIYLYRNLKDAWWSQKKRGRGWWDVNQMKLSNNAKIFRSDRNLIRLMKSQRTAWMECKRDNILVIPYSMLFTLDGQERIEDFVRRPLLDYPKYRRHPSIPFEVPSELQCEFD